MGRHKLHNVYDDYPFVVKGHKDGNGCPVFMLLKPLLEVLHIVMTLKMSL